MPLSMLLSAELYWLPDPVCTAWRGSQPLAEPSTREASEKPPLPAADAPCGPSRLLAGLQGVAAAAVNAGVPGLQLLPAVGLPKLPGPVNGTGVEHSSGFPEPGAGGLTNRERLRFL